MGSAWATARAGKRMLKISAETIKCFEDFCFLRENFIIFSSAGYSLH